MATNFIENEILNPKNSKNKTFGDLNLLESQNLKNYLQNGIWRQLFSK